MSTRLFLFIALLAAALWTSETGARGSKKTWVEAKASAPSCTLDVVLVTFRNATTQASWTAYDYHNHDRPYGTNPGESADSSYTRRDFERLFSGGYDSLRTLPFVGSSQTVGKGHRLPEVFGSVRAYYDSMSLDPKDRAKGMTKGKFQLHVRLVNPDDGDGYPRWIELPRTKADYARIASNNTRLENRFWNDAYNAAWNAVQSWNKNIEGYSIADLPNSDSDDFSWQRLVRRKVVYLYSGATFTDENTTKLLHPQADMTTLANPSEKSDVGYRYVMGEREGWGNTNHAIDEFAGIGLHVHEIGHLLGLKHGDGAWKGKNPHMPREAEVATTADGANFVGWGLMQGGREGPEKKDTTKGLSRAYSSCPVPINPFYRMDLGWLAPTPINASQNAHPLELGSVHMIDTGTRVHPTGTKAPPDILLLERRSNNSFGRYISFYEFENQDPGLLIWRRNEGNTETAERPILIVADGRRIRNARDQEANFRVPEYQDQLSDPFPVSANVYPLYGESTTPSYAQPTVNAVYAITDSIGLRQRTSCRIPAEADDFRLPRRATCPNRL